MPRLPLAAALITLGLHLGAAQAAGPVDAACVHPLGTSAGALELAAQQAFRAQRYPAAYGRYVRLADAGHAPSAEMALFMLLNGPSLFASEWSASDSQQRCWNALAVSRARLRVAMHTDRGSD